MFSPAFHVSYILWSDSSSIAFMSFLWNARNLRTSWRINVRWSSKSSRVNLARRTLRSLRPLHLQHLMHLIHLMQHLNQHLDQHFLANLESRRESWAPRLYVITIAGYCRYIILENVQIWSGYWVSMTICRVISPFDPRFLSSHSAAEERFWKPLAGKQWISFLRIRSSWKPLQKLGNA